MAGAVIYSPFGSTMRGIERPMGVVEYETMLTKAIPKELKSNLPTIKEIETELSEGHETNKN